MSEAHRGEWEDSNSSRAGREILPIPRHSPAPTPIHVPNVAARPSSDAVATRQQPGQPILRISRKPPPQLALGQRLRCNALRMCCVTPGVVHRADLMQGRDPRRCLATSLGPRGEGCQHGFLYTCCDNRNSGLTLVRQRANTAVSSRLVPFGSGRVCTRQLLYVPGGICLACLPVVVVGGSPSGLQIVDRPAILYRV